MAAVAAVVAGVAVAVVAGEVVAAEVVVSLLPTLLLSVATVAGRRLHLQSSLYCPGRPFFIPSNSRVTRFGTALSSMS